MYHYEQGIDNAWEIYDNQELYTTVLGEKQVTDKIVAALNFYEQHYTQHPCRICKTHVPEMYQTTAGDWICIDVGECSERAHNQERIQCYICERPITSFRETHGEKVCSNADDCIAFYNSQHGFV